MARHMPRWVAAAAMKSAFIPFFFLHALFILFTFSYAAVFMITGCWLLLDTQPFVIAPESIRWLLCSSILYVYLACIFMVPRKDFA